MPVVTLAFLLTETDCFHMYPDLCLTFFCMYMHAEIGFRFPIFLCGYSAQP